MTELAELDEWLTTDEVAALIRMDRDYVQRQCKAGALKGKKLGTEWRISRRAVAEFMNGTDAAPPTRTRSARQERRARQRVT